MKDPEARRRLKEMLEFQMKEKQEVELIARKKKNSLRQGRPPVRQASLMQSQSTSLLPPLNVKREVPQAPLAQTMTPSRKAQGYASLNLPRGSGGTIKN